MLLILGAGESGVGAALLARKLGMPVFVSDFGLIRSAFKDELIQNEIDFEEGSHDLAMETAPECIIKSPGIPDDTEILNHFKEQGVPVISEIEFAYRHCSGTIVAITGSNGKTTTTNLCYHLLASAGRNVVKAGNVGYSFARAVAQGTYKEYVLELSSFQLDGIVHFKPHIAILLNITPDHMDRYQNRMDLYVASKFRIAGNQGPSDFLIFYDADQNIKEYLSRHPQKSTLIPIHPVLDENEQVLQDDSVLAKLATTVLKGKHNAINVACAVTVAQLSGIDAQTVQDALNQFVNDPHRLEYIATVQGVDFINDSKATNVDSVFWALDAMKRPVVWIAGGLDKGNDYTSLEHLVRQKVKAIVCLGKDNFKVLRAFKDIVAVVEDTHSMSDAVGAAARIASPGDLVLLSPACASFDLFKNYEDRGDQFRQSVALLKTQSI